MSLLSLLPPYNLLLDLSVWKYVGTSFVAQTLATIFNNVVLSKLLFQGVPEKELQAKNGIFRDMKDPMIMYMFIFTPIFHACNLFVASKLFNFAINGNMSNALKLSIGLWAFGPAVGIFIDHMSLKISSTMSSYFWLCTFEAAVINGMILSMFF
jgi:hypothetical protein